VQSFPHRLGVHVSIAGGIERAVSRAVTLNCTAMQIFSRNPRGWNASPLSLREVATFREAVGKKGIDPVVVHTPYLLNIASGNEALHRRSISALVLDIKRAERLRARFVVTHLGSAKGRGKAFGVGRVVKALMTVMERRSMVSLLLENSAGAGNTVGSSFDELQEILNGLGRNERLGVCFDTCHGFAAGYDFRSPEGTEELVREMDRTFGVGRVALIHLNDCSGQLGEHIDRHEHIGRGKIGMSGFRSLLGHPLLRGLPMILETPKDHPEDDFRNLSRIRRILQSGSTG